MSITDELRNVVQGLRALSAQLDSPWAPIELDDNDHPQFVHLVQRGGLLVEKVLGEDSEPANLMWEIYRNHYSRTGGARKIIIRKAIQITNSALNAVEIGELTKSNARSPSSRPYVSPIRIEELQSVSNPKKYDTARLVQLCKELNVAYQHECWMTVAMIVRTIMHHIPPALGHKEFTHVASNYGGTKFKSFKDNLKRLDGSLKPIADSILHDQIKPSTSLPTERQVSFSEDLDRLLEEVCRVLKHPEDPDGTQTVEDQNP